MRCCKQTTSSLGAESIFQNSLCLAQRSDLIGTCLLAILIAGVALAACWLQVLQILHNCVKLRGGVLQLSLQALHLLLQTILLSGFHLRVLLCLLKRDLLGLHILLVVQLVSLILNLGISFHTAELLHDSIEERQDAISAILRISDTSV